jgi:hypothetical protein
VWSVLTMSKSSASSLGFAVRVDEGGEAVGTPPSVVGALSTEVLPYPTVKTRKQKRIGPSVFQCDINVLIKQVGGSELACDSDSARGR